MPSPFHLQGAVCMGPQCRLCSLAPAPCSCPIGSSPSLRRPLVIHQGPLPRRTQCPLRGTILPLAACATSVLRPQSQYSFPQKVSECLPRHRPLPSPTTWLIETSLLLFVLTKRILELMRSIIGGPLRICQPQIPYNVPSIPYWAEGARTHTHV